MEDRNLLRKSYDDLDDKPLFKNLDDDDEDDLNMDNKLKEENYYKYHENVQQYDPRGQPYSYFYITLMGQIEYGEFMELDGLQLHYSFVAGEDWSVADGDVNGTG